MGMLMPLILQFAKLCIIGFALVVQGSSGHNASPSPTKFSIFPPTEGIPGAVVQRSDSPSPPSQLNGSDLHSPPALPPLMSALVPETNEGHARSLSPSNSMKAPPPNTAPPPFTSEDRVPSLAPNTPVVLPPFDTAPPPQPVQVYIPSESPTVPQKKEPDSKSPLSVPNAPGHARSLSPSNSMKPLPPNTEGRVPSLAPNTPAALPPFDTAPPPLPVQVHAPPESPTAPQKKKPVSKSPLSVPNAPGHARSLSPSNSMKPPPPNTEDRVPSLAPNTPVVLPPFDTAPPPLFVQVHTPPASPTAPQKKEPISKSPLSVPNAPGHARPLSPSNSMKPPPPNAEGRVPSLAPNAQVVLPPFDTAPPPLFVQVHTPPESPTAPQKEKPVSKSPLSVANAPAPVASPSRNLPQNSPAIHPFPSTTPSQNSPENSPVVHLTPEAPPLRNSPQNSPSIHYAPVAPQLRNSPQNPPAVHSSKPSALAPNPSANQGNSSNNRAPVMKPIAPAPVATPWIKSLRNQTDIHSRGPTALPPSAPIPEHTTPVSVASPPRKLERTPPPVHSIKPPSVSPVPIVSPLGKSPHNSPTIHPNVPGGSPSELPDPDSSPVSPPLSINLNNDGIPVASPKNEIHKPGPPVNHTSENGSSPAISPSAPTTVRNPGNSPIPSLAPLNKGNYSPALSPSISFHKHQHTRNERTSPAPASSYPISPPPLKQQVSPSHSAVPSSVSTVSPVPSPSPMTAPRQTKMPLISPKVSPVSPSRSPKVPPPPPLMSFPPPPPNEDCLKTICREPYTNTPPGSPCSCVLPMQVGLSLSVALYTFFPLVSELAEEIATGVFMKQSQVRIIGANAPSEQPEKTVVLIDLVPLGEKFDSTTAFLTYQRFWHKQVAINTSLFGDYEVLYVRYLGLPPSPPLPPSDAGIINAGPYPGNDNNARAIKPLGVDVHGKRHKYQLSGGVISIIILSMLVAVVLCSAIAWFLLFKRSGRASQQAATPQLLPASLAKPAGSVGSMVGSCQSSTSLSFGSSIVAYTGSAKTFSASDIEKATDNFDASRILGEGGFGRVYSGVLEDRTEVAVKVLKRDDQQGGREFLAEVEMLSRLHHRNLVKLIGICTEERNRCLVYELIPNGSVESHLHGVDKESAPLDWDARIKIALGAARGLAYLHEDSSPRVIHRDFKSSNILLEHDFTPKVSDFGLARTAMDEEGRHISTRVMGTFGYVAPEYAMTGHLLVKSDVYSYGVVLLELLTGRKPVDMTQPPGQENLVAWARPLLASKEGLETIIDPSLDSDVPFDSVAKVAAIASMCVQPEVSHRPFMGEVVQALKLVCNECDEAKEIGSRGSSQDDISIDLDARGGTVSGQLTNPLQSHYSIPNDDSGLDPETGLSVSEVFSSSARIGRQSSGSFRRHSSSGPLRTGRGSTFWQKVQRFSRGSVSEHGVTIRFWPGSH